MVPLLLILLPALVLCFSASDIEIFKLRNAIAKDLGEDTTFYSWLGVSPKATHKQISNALRKLSRKIHPDKNPGAAANERYARLNSIRKILFSEAREQYDYYLRHGFPEYHDESDQWTFKRYRPTIIVVVALLAVLVTAVHFAMLKANASRRRIYFENLQKDVRDAATVNSKSGVLTTTARVQLNGRNFFVEPTGEVFFEGELVTSDVGEEPTIWDTVILRRLVKRPAAPAESEAAGASAAPTSGKAKVVAKEETATLSKGAARRRPAAARGKAKIF